VYVKRVKRTSK